MNFKMMKFEGTDPNALPEILIYFFIQELGDIIWTMRRAVQKFDADPTEVKPTSDNAYHDQQQLLEIIKSRPGFNFANHAEYLLWYRWWHHWHMNELTPEQWSELKSLITWDGTQTEASFAAWRPKGHWKT